MLCACPYCGRIHDRRVNCGKRPLRKRAKQQDAFRSTQQWQRKRALPSDVRAAAIQVAHEIMAQQCEQVVRRSWNEMLVAMHQAGLSPRTIRRGTEKLDNVVLPYVDDLRNPDGGLKNAGNAQHVRDGDIWVQEYLTGHGIPCYEIVEVET